MPASTPKYRQTCDSCRKAKTKCDSAKPACSRCLVTGANCDYGISNQGGRWKNGQKMGSRHHSQSSPESVQSVAPGKRTPHDGTLSMQVDKIPSAGETFWQACTDTAWECEPIFSPNLSYYHWTNTAVLPLSPTTTPSLSPRAPYFGMQFAEDSFTSTSQQQFNDAMAAAQIPSAVSPDHTDSGACVCISTATMMLQNLHQGSSFLANSRPEDRANTAGCAAILDLNEETISHCSATLNCQVCRPEEKADLVILVSTLLRKAFSLAKAWALDTDIDRATNTGASNGIQHHNESSPEVMGLKAEVLSITVQSLEDLVPRLKETGQALGGSHDRLACAALCASISQDLRNAREALSSS